MLRESKGNMYSFITHTVNFCKGECFHDCTYCYCKRWGKQKLCRLDEKEFKTDLGSGNYIFVGSSCDMFNREIPREWITKILKHCDSFDNRYLFQSKNPERFLEFAGIFPKKTVLCTTIETNRFIPYVMNKSPKPEIRSFYMGHDLLAGYDKYVTVEPVMDFDLSAMVKVILGCDPVQINIGADTGYNNLPEPEPQKIVELISELKKFTVVHEKTNLLRILRSV
jgi:DNA repair photolyase